MKKITPEILKSWSPCSDGYERFLQLLPEGGTLEECVNALVFDGHDDWGKWLFDHCAADELFKDQTLGGYRNSGYRNSGYRNSGYRNSGDWNSGNRNSGDLNSGHRNSGHRNSGHRNSGDLNSGDLNSGDLNSGDLNSGNWNSGDLNSGNWNSGNRNSGYFNTAIPDEILIFNKPCPRKAWNECKKPDFIYFQINEWISEDDMTDQEKIDNPKFFVAGGYLKRTDYKDAWRKSWDAASEEDRRLVLNLPNFDADVFLEISGIDVRKELSL